MMLRFHVWKKSRVMLALVALCAVSAFLGGWLVSLFPDSQKPPDGQAVSVFAEVPLFAEIALTPSPTTLAAQPTPSAEVAPTADDSVFRVEVVRATPVPTTLVHHRVLIYHTHTWEAFAQVETAPYVETEKWRTKDNHANVVAVGEALAVSLRTLGVEVVHDTTAFEPPELSSAYQRSLSMLEERTRNGETYDLYIDLHRDAASAMQTVNIGGQEVARFMMLIGKGTGQAGQGYDVKPDWEANYAIAQQLTDSLNSMQDGLCRSIAVKSGRFNQHIAPRCILIECGSNRNTLEQVLRGVPYLAQAVADAIVGE